MPLGAVSFVPLQLCKGTTYLLEGEYVVNAAGLSGHIQAAPRLEFDDIVYALQTFGGITEYWRR